MAFLALKRKKRKHLIKSFEFFQHVLLKLESILTRICQVIKLENYINISENPIYIYIYIERERESVCVWGGKEKEKEKPGKVWMYDIRKYK